MVHDSIAYGALLPITRHTISGCSHAPNKLHAQEHPRLNGFIQTAYHRRLASRHERIKTLYCRPPFTT